MPDLKSGPASKRLSVCLAERLIAAAVALSFLGLLLSLDCGGLSTLLHFIPYVMTPAKMDTANWYPGCLAQNN